MARKVNAPETPAALLAAIAAGPGRRRELFAAAMTGPGQVSIGAAIQDDPTLRAEYRAALTDLVGLDQSPWLVQYARRLVVRDAIPELLVIAKTDSGSKAQQAAQALVAFEDRASLDALATNVPSQVWTRGESIKALFLLGGDAAFTRLCVDVAAGGTTSATTLFHLVAHPEIVADDARWIDVALAALRTPKGAGAAREVLRKSLTPELRAAHFAGSPPAVVAVAVSPDELVSARAWADKLFAKLPAFPAPTAAVHERLDALAQIVGRVPSFVRAVHERVDGLDVPGAKSADRVVLYDTAAILKAARAWDAEHDPRHTPRELVLDFLWPVAPDGFTRAGLSGGPAYAFAMPGGDADPVLSNAPKKPSYAQLVARELKKAARNLARSGS
jgi:hypothetical protein